MVGLGVDDEAGARSGREVFGGLGRHWGEIRGGDVEVMYGVGWQAGEDRRR